MKFCKKKNWNFEDNLKKCFKNLKKKLRKFGKMLRKNAKMLKKLQKKHKAKLGSFQEIFLKIWGIVEKNN